MPKNRKEVRNPSTRSFNKNPAIAAGSVPIIK